MSEAENGAERAENQVDRGVERSVERECQKTMERSGRSPSERSQSGNGAGSRGYKNRLERGAAFSHML